MMNRKEGKIRSAGVKPFHYAWSINHGGYGPELSTRIIPSIVSPLRISNEFNLCLTGGAGGTTSYEVKTSDLISCVFKLF